MKSLNYLIKFSLVCLLFLTSQISAQEFICNVQISAPKLQSNPANQETFDELRTKLVEFMNETKWTEDIFGEFEKIDCSILITIDDSPSVGSFTGSIQVGSSRPVYNSNYKSQVFMHKDNEFDFAYSRGTPLLFTPDRHSSNLTAVIAYYAYMMLGHDYDSFAKDGGTKYFIKAQQIATNAQGSPASGWSQGEERNRTGLIDNTLQNVYKPLRQCIYNYHKKGFDIMYEKKDESINMIISSLELLRKVHRVRPLSLNQQIFFNAKRDELIQLFKEGNPDQKKRFIRIASELDPTHTNNYNKVN